MRNRAVRAGEDLCNGIPYLFVFLLLTPANAHCHSKVEMRLLPACMYCGVADFEILRTNAEIIIEKTT